MNESYPKGGVIIPAYREAKRIAGVVREVLKHIRPVIVVDDGSPDSTAAEAEAAGAIVIRHARNLGKGAALNTGFTHAIRERFDFVITMDADGQHAPADIPRFIEEYRRSGVAVLVGSRMADPKGMPLIRKLTNRCMSWYLSRAMGQSVPDTQSGFRLYGAKALPLAATKSSRYDAESETLLRLAFNKIKIGSVPITVIYRGDEKSKIRPFRDTLRFFKMVWNFKRGTEKEATNFASDR